MFLEVGKVVAEGAPSMGVADGAPSMVHHHQILENITLKNIGQIL